MCCFHFARLYTMLQLKFMNNLDFHLWKRRELVLVVDLGFTMQLTSQVISVAFYSEREKSDKFCSEALISAWGSFNCRKSKTRDPRLYFPSEGNHTQDFLSSGKIHRPRPGFNPRTSDPVASMITMGLRKEGNFAFSYAYILISAKLKYQ